MAQFDVHANNSKKTSAAFPYLLEIQSNLFKDSTRVVVVPLMLASKITSKDSALNPEFEIDNRKFILFPLDIASMNKKLLGATIGNYRHESDRIDAALDLLFARF